MMMMMMNNKSTLANCGRGTTPLTHAQSYGTDTKHLTVVFGEELREQRAFFVPIVHVHYIR
jgi:hypothetical protein